MPIWNAKHRQNQLLFAQGVNSNCGLIKSGRNDKKQLTFYMDYIMINRYRTLVRIRRSTFAVVKYVKKYTDWKISDHWMSGDAEKTAGPDLGGRI